MTALDDAIRIVEGRLTMDVTVGVRVCAICRQNLAEDQARLLLDLRDETETYSVAVCRPCLAEYAPDLLAYIEKEPE